MRKRLIGRLPEAGRRTMIVGREVADDRDTEIHRDVSEKMLRSVRTGLAVTPMKGKSYLFRDYYSIEIVGFIHQFRI